MAIAEKILYANNATSTLASGINETALSLSVQSGHGARFPSPSAGECFIITLRDAAGNTERIIATGRNVDSFSWPSTAYRGADGTTARSWAAGDKVEIRLGRLELQQLVDQTGRSVFAVGGGTGNAITASFTPTFAALLNGMEVRVRAPAANTGAATFAPDGLTAKEIVKENNLALVANDIVQNQEITLRYNSTLDKWVLLNPAVTSRVVTTDTAQTITGAKTMDANFVVGTNATARQLRINGPAGTQRLLILETAGSRRWIWDGTPTAESGSNAGTDLRLQRCADDTSVLGSLFQARRSDGAVQAGNNPTGGFAGADIWNFAQTPRVNNVNLVTLSGAQDIVDKTYNGLSISTGTDTFTLTRGASTLVRSGAHALTLTTTGATNVTLGAHALTLTTTGATNVTLPTTGTLATLAGAEAFTNKTYEGLSISTGTNTFTLTRGTATLVRSGAHALTLTTTGATNVTLPTSGTLATIAGTETLTNKTYSGGTIIGTITNSGTISGGTVNATTLQQGGIQVVTISGTQTLTNKTLTTPVIGQITPSSGLQIGSPTGGDKGSGTLNTAGTIYQNNSPVALARDTSFQTAGMVKLAAGANSEVATEDIAWTNYTAYKHKLLRITRIRPATDNVALLIRVSTNGGSTFATSGYRNGATGINTAGGAVTISGATSAMQLSTVHSSGLTRSLGSFDVWFDDTTALDTFPAARWHGRYPTTGATPDSIFISGCGQYETDQDTDAIRIMFNSGNIAEIEWHLYGWN